MRDKLIAHLEAQGELLVKATKELGDLRVIVGNVGQVEAVEGSLSAMKTANDALLAEVQDAE